MALLESGPALWQQENDAPPSTRLRSSKAATGSENSMATPYTSKQAGKQPSQTARKALSNISNINHLHKQQPLQPSKAQQPLATITKSRVTIANDAADMEAAPAQEHNKMDTLAAQLARSDGIERPAGLGWEQQYAMLQHTAMQDAAARATAMAALANRTAALSLADAPALTVCPRCAHMTDTTFCAQALEPEACPPSPPAPFTGAMQVPLPGVDTCFDRTDAEMVDILFPQMQLDDALLCDLLPSLSSSPPPCPRGSPAFSVEEDCNVCFEGGGSPPQPPSPPAYRAHSN